jgi:hypothetical protein
VTSLTDEERERLATAERMVSEGRPRPLSYERLLAAWESLVREVEQGYPATIDDYTNDLTSRDLLQEIVGACDESLREELTASIEPLDERFRRATRPDEQGRIAEFIEPGAGWWWSRLPLRLEGDLAADLASE